MCIDTAEVVFKVCCDLKCREHFITLYSLLFHPSLGIFRYHATDMKSVGKSGDCSLT